MKQDALQQTSKYAKAHQRKRRWYKAVSCLAAVVVFCTTYALILPAITMEQDAKCGIPEHVHDESCYIVVSEPHVHDESCYELVGGHAHTDDCYTLQRGEVTTTPTLATPRPPRWSAAWRRTRTTSTPLRATRPPVS